MLKCLQSKNGSREEAEKNGARAENAREVPLPDQACAVKMDGYWPSFFLHILWTVNVDKTAKENEVNVQPSRTGKLGY